MRNNKKPSKPFVVDFEAEAEAFLQKYCKEVLDTPQATPIRDIAQKGMSLDIVDTERLSSDDSIQGAIIFSAGIMDVYDCLSEEYVGYEVSRPTIFLDAGIINQGRLNNTLAHECYHWYTLIPARAPARKSVAQNIRRVCRRRGNRRINAPCRIALWRYPMRSAYAI